MRLQLFSPETLVLSLILASLSTAILLNMWRANAPPYSAIMAVALSTMVDMASSSPDLGWYKPNATDINDLSVVINGTGVFGFQFQPVTPPSLPPTTYNWCNMPRVNPETYDPAPDGFKLEYVEVIHRHHKRTPYADNTFPHETYVWDCDDERMTYAGVPLPDGQAVNVAWNVYTSPANPLVPSGFNGTCRFPQITADGLGDSREHGKDLFAVYHDKLGFLPSNYDESRVSYRVTNNVITSQVASQLILGMYPDTVRAPASRVNVLIQPYTVDSLEPGYTCSAASTLYASYGVDSSAANWTAHLNESAALFAKLDSISGISSSSSAWHRSFDHYFDNLSARLCHNKALPCNSSSSYGCVTQADADAVFRAGQYEYSFIHRDSPDSLAASTASYGVWAAELSANLKAAQAGTSPFLYRHNVAHDGSVSRLLSILQIDVMVWPGMGSEVVFELYSTTTSSRKGRSWRRDTSNQQWFIRVLFGGQVLRSSNPSLGYLDFVPVSVLTDYIDGLVGVGAANVPELC
ncbi:hypothetical protein DV735_g1820, partial [Chaetothyriales sp. CBS 134920]